MSCEGGVKTAHPGTISSALAPGKSFRFGLRSAMVLYPVAFTNLSNCALVIGVLSIQKPSTVTRWAGAASGMSQVSQPIQKVPPGTQTIPSGAGPGAGAVLTPVAASLITLTWESAPFEPP